MEKKHKDDEKKMTNTDTYKQISTCISEQKPKPVCLQCLQCLQCFLTTVMRRQKIRH
jgi:hypothetical protein